jgi:hypothetical protein
MGLYCSIQTKIDKDLYTYRIPREAKNLVLYAPHRGHMKATFGLFPGVFTRNWPMDPVNRITNNTIILCTVYTYVSVIVW